MEWIRSRSALLRSLLNRLASDRKFFLFASFYSLFPNSFSQSVISSLKKLRGRSADRRHCLSAPRIARYHALCGRGAGAPNGARSPTGAPPRHLRQRTNATAQLQPALPGTRRHQVLPASGLSIQSSELPRSTGRSAGRAYPPKPPGSGLRSRPREPHSPRFRDRLEKRPHTSEPFLRNRRRYIYQWKSDGTYSRLFYPGRRFLPRVRIGKFFAVVAPPAKGILQMLRLGHSSNQERCGIGGRAR